jgi:diphthine synthase
MFYLIGLGLDLNSISAEALLKLRNSKKVYLENYTVNFPYKIEELKKQLEIKLILLNRENVEKEEFLKEAKNSDVSLLVYGSPLDATTHISLILKCKQEDIKYKIFHNSSIFDAITETGLQLYKFGKTTSMPKFQEKFHPTSFLDVLKENNSINAHTLILTDIGLSFQEALNQLKESLKEKRISLEKIIVISKAGTKKSKVFHNSIEELSKQKVEMPFCIIIPGELHFFEQEALNQLKEK